MINRQELVGTLLKNNEAFKKLYQRHRKLDQRVQDLDRKAFLTAEQQFEITRLKKLKLQSKDQMEEILIRHEKDRTAQGINPGP